MKITLNKEFRTKRERGSREPIINIFTITLKSKNSNGSIDLNITKSRTITDREGNLKVSGVDAYEGHLSKSEFTVISENEIEITNDGMTELNVGIPNETVLIEDEDNEDNDNNPTPPVPSTSTSTSNTEPEQKPEPETKTQKLSSIMKRAWEIFRNTVVDGVKAIFSLCLKMAWAEARI